MPVPLPHLVFGGACGVLPVEAYRVVGADACEAGGFRQAALTGCAAYYAACEAGGFCQAALTGCAACAAAAGLGRRGGRGGRGGTFGGVLPGCAACATAVVLPGCAVVVLGRNGGWRGGGGLLRLCRVIGGNQRVAQRQKRDCARRPKQRPQSVCCMKLAFQCAKLRRGGRARARIADKSECSRRYYQFGGAMASVNFALGFAVWGIMACGEYPIHYLHL